MGVKTSRLLTNVLMKREVGEVQSSQVATSPSAITGTQ